MKAERCQATAASGQPCSATPRPGRPFCLWHDPEADEQRRELSRRGGKARSNQARAKKQLPNAVLTADELQGLVGGVLRKVIAGKTEPAIGNCVANLARSLVSLREATELEQRLSALEARAGMANDRRFG